MALVRCSRRESLGPFWNGLNGSIIVARMKGATEADQVLSPHVCALDLDDEENAASQPGACPRAPTAGKGTAEVVQ